MNLPLNDFNTFCAILAFSDSIKITLVLKYNLVLPWTNKAKFLGGSPGFVVMGDDSCSRGRGFDSQHRKLDGHDIFNLL